MAGLPVTFVVIVILVIRFAGMAPLFASVSGSPTGFLCAS